MSLIIILMTWHCLNGELDSDPKAKCIENEEFNLDVKYLESKKMGNDNEI